MIKRHNWLVILLILAFVAGMLPAGNPPAYAGVEKTVKKIEVQNTVVTDVYETHRVVRGFSETDISPNFFDNEWTRWINGDADPMTIGTSSGEKFSGLDEAEKNYLKTLTGLAANTEQYIDLHDHVTSTARFTDTTSETVTGQDEKTEIEDLELTIIITHTVTTYKTVTHTSFAIVHSIYEGDSLPGLEPATDLSASDLDGTQPGVDGRDFHITWTPSATPEVTSQKLYILPASALLDSSTQNPVAVFDDNTTSSWTGGESLTTDSAGVPLAAGDYMIYVFSIKSPNEIQTGVNLTVAGETQPSSSGIIYVKHDAAGANNGTSWTDAFTTLQAALDVASAGKKIWVAAGTYYPTSYYGLERDDRYKQFRMKNGVAIYGGFAGSEEPDFDLDGRNFAVHETILSGDIGQNDVITDGVISNNGENSYHVFYHSELDLDSSAVLDGFTITGGNADGPASENGENLGGGMYNYMSSPSLSNLTFSRNSTSLFGGGMFNQKCSPSLVKVTFNDNRAKCGAGMFNAEDGNPTLTDLAFNNNVATLNGGGMQNENNSITINGAVFNNNQAIMGGGMHDWNNVQKPGARVLNNVTFNSNASTSEGGGMYIDSVGFTLNNVSFNGNSSGKWGGGLFIFASPVSALNQTTFDSNTASEYGGGIYNFSGSLTLDDVAFHNNRAQLHGGGLHNYMSPSLKLKDAVFDQNQAQENGGGIYSIRCNPSFTNVTFSGNSAKNGGGVCCDESDGPSFTNVVFKGNTAVEDGGGMFNDLSSPALTNATFSGNAAKNGGGMRNHGSGSTIANCVLWGNSAEVGGSQLLNTRTSPASPYFPTISHSLVEGCGGSGTGWNPDLGDDGGYNLDSDPLFVDAVAGNLRLQAASPAIDGGDNAALPAGVTTDLDGSPRIANDIVDMGAYEYQGAPVNTYTLTLYADPAAGGTAIDETDDGPYPVDTAVKVAAAANSGYRFVNWTVDDIVVSTSATFEYTMPARDVVLVANFASTMPQSVSIFVSASPAEGGSVGGGGTYQSGQSVTVTAAPQTGYSFVNWTEGESVVSITAEYTFTAFDDHILVAHFAPTAPQSISIAVSASPAEGGSVSGGGTYQNGQWVTVTAAPQTGYGFVNWTEGESVVSTNAEYSFAAETDRALVAHFAPIIPQSVSIFVSASPAEGGSVSGGGTYQSGQSVTVTAAPQSGYSFVNWTEGESVVSTNAEYSFAAETDRALVAHFEPIVVPSRYSLTIEKEGNGRVDASPAPGEDGKYSAGQEVQLTATSDPGWKFVKWDIDGVTATTSTVSVVMSADKRVQANFQTAPPPSGGNGGGGGGSPPQPNEPVKPPAEPEVEAPTVEEPTDLAGHWAHGCVIALLQHGIIEGYPDGTIRPENEITRAEAAVLLVSALGLTDYQPQSMEKPYQDEIPDWARKAILTAAEKGLMKGYPDGTFKPDQRITRAEMCAALMQAFPRTTPAGFVLGFTDAGSIPDWARTFVAAAVSNGVVSGYPDNTFRPNNNIKRGEVFSIICRLMGYHGVEQHLGARDKSARMT
ncbi:MAG: hypothetical protein HPY50_08545 [Firmicutes bacterium]|nr:hypothetical protein [Bacillota bacterium]